MKKAEYLISFLSLYEESQKGENKEVTRECLEELRSLNRLFDEDDKVIEWFMSYLKAYHYLELIKKEPLKERLQQYKIFAGEVDFAQKQFKNEDSSS